MALRLVIQETEGSRRSYSYIFHEGSEPLSTAEIEELLQGEFETLAQSDSAPPFLFAPSGELSIDFELT